MLNQDKHRVVMYRLLTGIFRDSFLSAVLGFKGGTACYFFYNLPRFSVDLDFDITDHSDLDNICKKAYKKIKKIIMNENLTVRDEFQKRNTGFFLLSYENAQQNIKVEVSSRKFPNTYEIKDFYGLPVKVLVRGDMFAHKLAAATDRKKTASRDFFDIWYFLKQGWPINEAIVKLRTGKDIRTYLAYLAGFVEKHLANRTILQGMGELIDGKQKARVKNSMKDELIGMLRFMAEVKK